MRLKCPHCGWESLAGYTEKIEWLRGAGRLRRAAKPEPELVDELFGQIVTELRCPDCREGGLEVDSGLGDDDDDDWLPTGRACDRCGEVIPRERLEVFPDTRYCTACQRSVEQGVGAAGAHDYCPRCGSLMTMRTTSSRNRASYQFACTSCGYRGT